MQAYKQSRLQMQSLMLTMVMILGLLTPLVTADDGQNENQPTVVNPVVYSLNDFNPETMGKAYLIGEDQSLFSATRYLKQQWQADDYPQLRLPFEETSARTAGRACENAWTTGQVGVVSTPAVSYTHLTLPTKA